MRRGQANAPLTVAAVAAVLLSAGCGDGDPADGPFGPLAPDPRFPGTAGPVDAHADLFAFDPLSGCAAVPAGDLAVTTPLRIFSGPGVTDADLRRFLGGLQRYYTRYGVTMTTAYDVLPVPFREGLILDLDLVTAHVERETGLDVDGPLTSEQEGEVLAAVGRSIMHNLRELTRVYGVPRRPEINVVLLPEMVTDKLDPSLQEFQGLLGVGVSPELLAATSPDDPAIQLYDWLGATGDFSPLAVVGVGPVNRALPEPDIPMAHELAHTYGLPHVQDAGNLLHQGSFECTLSLTDPQLERIRSALAGAAGRGPGIAALSLTNRAGDFVQAIRRRLTPER